LPNLSQCISNRSSRTHNFWRAPSAHHLPATQHFAAPFESRDFIVGFLCQLHSLNAISEAPPRHTFVAFIYLFAECCENYICPAHSSVVRFDCDCFLWPAAQITSKIVEHTGWEWEIGGIGRGSGNLLIKKIEDGGNLFLPALIPKFVSVFGQWNADNWRQNYRASWQKQNYELKQVQDRSVRWSWGAAESLGPLITLVRLGAIRIGCPCPGAGVLADVLSPRERERAAGVPAAFVIFSARWVLAQIESNQNSSNIWHNLIWLPTAADGRNTSVAKAAANISKGL